MSVMLKSEMRVTYLFGVNSEGPSVLTVQAYLDLDLFVCILVERPKNTPTFATVKLNVFELRENACVACDNT